MGCKRGSSIIGTESYYSEGGLSEKEINKLKKWMKNMIKGKEGKEAIEGFFKK